MDIDFSFAGIKNEKDFLVFFQAMGEAQSLLSVHLTGISFSEELLKEARALLGVDESNRRIFKDLTLKLGGEDGNNRSPTKNEGKEKDRSKARGGHELMNERLIFSR